MHLKIAHVIARLNVGGPSVAVIAAAEGLRQRGHAVSLLTGEVPPTEASMEYLAREQDLPLTRITDMSRRISWWKDWVSFCRLLRIFRRDRTEVVHTHTAKAGTLGRLAAMFAGVPVRVHMFHGHVFRGYFSPAVSQLIITLERWLARSCDCIVAISESQRRELVEEFRIAPAHKVVTIPLGLEFEPFLSVERRQNRAEKRLRSSASSQVGWIGRLTPIKDPVLFIEVAALLKATTRQARQVMVGDGELRSKCEAAITEKHLQDHVSILGWQRQMENVYAEFDLLVLTSINEGTPLVLLEAMATSCAFVAVDVGGVRDLMAGNPVRRGNLEIFDNGILVPRDARVLADAVSYLLDREDLRASMGRAGREFVRRRFSKERMIQDFESLYLRLLRSKSGLHQPSEAAAAAKSPVHS